MGFVFISYSRQDTTIVDNIVSRLKSDGFEVWIDREAIKGGGLWRTQIVKAIHTSDAFILMLSPNSAASENVRKEVDLAESAKRRLFPFLLASVDLPEELLYQLAGIQWIEFYANPEEKYQELVEILREHQKSLSQMPQTRQMEVVMGSKTVKKFGAKEQEELLRLMAQKAETPRANLKLASITAGSVHAFVDMPADAAYTLKTAALNRDKDLIKYGIDAVRLDGEENFVLVKTGEIGPLQLKPPSSVFPRFLLTVIAIGLLAAGLFSVLSSLGLGFKPATLTPTLTFTPTQTNTPTPTNTLTPTSTSTQTLTPTITFTPTATPNLPPPAPELLNPKYQSTVSCDDSIFLVWNKSEDANGIAGYEVSLDVNIDGAWKNLFVQQVDGKTTQLNISKYVYNNCDRQFEWRVHAMDGAGAWGDWSAFSLFFAANAPPPAPILKVSPINPATGNVSCGAATQLTWNTPRDTSGISNYRIQLYVLKDGEWTLLIDETVGKVKSFDISKMTSSYCGYQFNARIIAQDNHGTWGDWSPMLDFSVDFPIPGKINEIAILFNELASWNVGTLRQAQGKYSNLLTF